MSSKYECPHLPVKVALYKTLYFIKFVELIKTQIIQLILCFMFERKQRKTEKAII